MSSRKSITIRGMRQRANRFLACQNFEALALLLRTPSLELLSLASNPLYDEFHIPKKNGSKRLIEDPQPKLKRIQRRLNDYLQAVYFFYRTDGAYGFLAAPVDDTEPRNILSHAERHLGCRWLLNVDMQDFFHQVKLGQVIQLFAEEPLAFKLEMAQVLGGLCCYKGRLPMGAPTSPILSNFACLAFDERMKYFADLKGWIYTRYADDISFSSEKEIVDEQVMEAIRQVEVLGYKLNPAKIKLYGPGDQKIVTGLIVGENEVNVPEDYSESLEQAILQLGQIVDAKFYTVNGRGRPSAWVKELEQQVRGKLAFASNILGTDDERIIALEMELEKALEPPENYGPISWLDFGYDFF